MYHHTIFTSSCWLGYSWNQGLLKWWDKLFRVFLGLCWMLIQLIQKSHVHQECWFSFMFRRWYSRNPSFQNFDWKGVMGCILLKAGWEVAYFRICLAANRKILCVTGIWKHWFSGGRPRLGQRRSSGPYWCLYCFFAWTSKDLIHYILVDV